MAAKDLVNDGSVRRVEGGMVTYFHLLFDEHEVIFSNGLASESFRPGPQVTAQLAPETVKETVRLFPSLRLMRKPARAMGPRRGNLRGYEAQLLLARRLHA